MRTKWVAAALVGIVVIGGSAFAAMRVLGSASTDAAVALVPEGAAVYTNLFVDPSVDQKMAIQDLSEKFPTVGSGEKVRGALIEALEEPLAEIGLDFEQDVQPWLGNQAAFFLLGGDSLASDEPDGAVLLATDDRAATSSAVEVALAADDSEMEFETASYKGIDYRLETGVDNPTAYGYVDDFLVAGTKEGFETVVDTSEGGPSLEGSEPYDAATGPLNDDRIALFYADTGAALDAAEAVEELTVADKDAISQVRELGGDEPSAFAAFARSDAVVLEGSYAIPEDGPLADLAGGLAEPGLVPELPGDTWFAFGLPNSGETIRTVMETIGGLESSGAGVDELSGQFEQQTGLSLDEDVLSWMGNSAFFVRGTNFQELNGGAAVESSDPAKTIETVEAIGEALEGQGVPLEPMEQEGGYEGFAVQLPGVPAPINVLGGPKLVIAYGDGATEELIAPEERLADGEVYASAVATLGEGFSTSTYVDIQAAVELLESVTATVGGDSPTYEDEVRPNLQPLAHLISGVKVDGGTFVTRVVVGTR